jgi:hypothetical protein
MVDRFCDYWLMSRSKCPERATVEAIDHYGAPLRFCPEHWAKQEHIRSQYGPDVRERSEISCR